MTTSTNPTSTQPASTQPTDTNQTGGPDIIPIEWGDVVDVVTAAGDGVFLATTGGDGRPHVAWVMPGWSDERMWIAIFADSQKTANLRHTTETAMTCDATPETNVIIRATARLVDDLTEVADLWNRGVLPYDPTMFFTGPDDQRLQFVELTPTHASIRALGPGPVRRWRPSTT